MVAFPAQTFVMGGTGTTPREQPQHEVTLDAFGIGDRCVSALDYYAFLREAPSDVSHYMIDCIDPCFVVHRAGGFMLRRGGENFPMIQISFWAAAAYCNWLSRSEGLRPLYDVANRSVAEGDGYRLPTEAEWEAAALHGGHDATSAADPTACNSADAGPEVRKLRAGEFGAGTFQPGQPGPVAVDALGPDLAGLHQMLGNVREWCQDRFSPYQSEPQHNPRGARTGAFRVVRGGAFVDAAGTLGPAARMAAYEDTRCEVYGFRVARSL